MFFFSQDIRHQCRVTRDVIPMIYVIGISRKNARDLVEDHIDRLTLRSAQSRIIARIAVRDPLKQLREFRVEPKWTMLAFSSC